MLYRYLRFLKTYYLLAKHLIVLFFRRADVTNKFAIIYVMRKKIYFQMALICISSFLYHNRDFKIIIYCDKRLYRLCNSFKFIFRNQSVEIRKEILSESDPMLEQVRMFMRTGNGNTILMDADIRWTGPLVYDFVKPLVYNYEKNLGHTQAWSQIKDYLGIHEIHNFEVFTCCLTSLGAHLPKNDKLEIESLLLRMLSFDWQESFELQQRFHIRGQFLISHIISELGIKPESIVSIEKKYSQSILETSYYGATGYRYGT